MKTRMPSLETETCLVIDSCAKQSVDDRLPTHSTQVAMSDAELIHALPGPIQAGSLQITYAHLARGFRSSSLCHLGKSTGKDRAELGCFKPVSRRQGDNQPESPIQAHDFWTRQLHS